MAADFDEAKEREAFESAMRSEGAKEWEFHRLIPQMDSFKRVAHVGRYVMDRTEYKWNGWLLARHQPSAPAWIAVSERLPDIEEWVLVLDGERMHVSCRSGHSDDFYWSDERVKISHWMLLDSLRALLPTQGEKA